MADKRMKRLQHFGSSIRLSTYIDHGWLSGNITLDEMMIEAASSTLRLLEGADSNEVDLQKERNHGCKHRFVGSRVCCCQLRLMILK